MDELEFYEGAFTGQEIDDGVNAALNPETEAVDIYDSEAVEGNSTLVSVEAMAATIKASHVPYFVTLNNGNAQSTYLVKAEHTTIGASYIVTVNRRGNVHGVLQAIIAVAGTTYIDVVMTAGTGITAALATGGFNLTIPSYSNFFIIADHPFEVVTPT